eukprot:569154-Rhodomonas_salina.1
MAYRGPSRNLFWAPIRDEALPGAWAQLSEFRKLLVRLLSAYAYLLLYAYAFLLPTRICCHQPTRICCYQPTRFCIDQYPNSAIGLRASAASNLATYAYLILSSCEYLHG